MSFVSGAITPENAALLSRIEELWRDGSLSMLGIGGKLGVSRSRVAALIARARKQPGGVERLPARPKLESNRLLRPAQACDQSRRVVGRDSRGAAQRWPRITTSLQPGRRSEPAR